MIDLQSFIVERRASRPELHEPFSAGEYTYATDGYVMVRIPRQSDVPEATKEAPWDKPFQWLESITFRSVTLDLPEKRVTDEECFACDGSGHEHDCPNCSCECEECGGSGKETPAQSVGIYGAFFNVKYLRPIAELPGLEIALSIEDRESSPLLFRFDGGHAAVMPMRSTFADHFEIIPEKAAA